MNENIAYYAKNAHNKWILKNYTIKRSEENRSCGEDVTVYLWIENNRFIDFSFDGDLSIITTACSSVLGESLIGEPIRSVFKMNYNTIVELIESEISPRRRRASVFALLATRNAIHEYLWDWEKDDFEDVWVEV